MRLSLESISNVKIDDTSWEQATHPVKYGGIGLSSAVHLAPSAFLASAAGSEKLISEILPENTHLDNELLFSAIEHWHAFSDADSTVVIKEPAAQKDWSAAVNKQKFARIHLVNAINETPRARVLAYQGKIAGAWLNAYPSKAIGLKLTDEQIRISLGLRLGVPLCEPFMQLWQRGESRRTSWSVLQKELRAISEAFNDQRHHKTSTYLCRPPVSA